ncbi:erythromycin esterase family protein [Streptomyces sp. NPDC057638]|uniref:erythromycin esterase family protein n=1 Tax=Streptomyces sp. NPDC057638 TaxID=3346190 RepID=UPI0036AA24DB
MTALNRPTSRRLLLATALTLSLGAVAPGVATAVPERTGAAASTAPTDTARAVIEDIERHSHRLRTADPAARGGDLAALTRMVGSATVVGVGEATHGSRELFQLKDRLFRQLVRTAGFTTFALETSWSSGARLDAYVRNGEGDLRQIMREEFQQSYADWNNEEFLTLFTWMREYNRSLAPERRLRVLGDDINDVHPAQIRRILDWAAGHRPTLAPELRQRYAGMLALPADAGERMDGWLTMPLERRQSLDRDVTAAFRLLERSGGVDPLVLQEARVITQMTSGFARDLNDPAQMAELNRLRDRAMAENTVWWQRHTGGRILLSAHNGHLGYETPFPETHPVVQGHYLRELMGSRYLAIGTTLHGGEYWATDSGTGKPGYFTAGPAAPGSNEHTIDRVRHRDYYVDLRSLARTPAAGPWLAGARPTFVIPSQYPSEPLPVSLGRTFDVLVHFERVAGARILT